MYRFRSRVHNRRSPPRSPRPAAICPRTDRLSTSAEPQPLAGRSKALGPRSKVAPDHLTGAQRRALVAWGGRSPWCSQLVGNEWTSTRVGSKSCGDRPNAIGGWARENSDPRVLARLIEICGSPGRSRCAKRGMPRQIARLGILPYQPTLSRAPGRLRRRGARRTA
jgi:hypothetical protein